MSRTKFEGKVTTNHYGTMYESIDEFTRSAIDLLKRKVESDPDRDHKALDAGCAFGYLTKRLLLEIGSNLHVIANDIGGDMLDKLRDELMELKMSQRVQVCDGPYLRLQIDAESLDAIFALRVVHFLTGDGIRESFERFYKWLRPSGILVISSATPMSYVFGNRGAQFIEMFKENEKIMREWPGECHNLHEFIECEQIARELPNEMTYSLLEQFLRESTRVGFHVYKCGYIDRDSFLNEANKSTNRDSFCLVLVKDIFAA